MSRRTTRRQSGFTLLEMIIVLALIGIVTVVLAPLVQWLRTSMQQTAQQQAVLDNHRLAAALQSYSGANTPLGTLPTPYSGGGYVHTVYNPSDTTAPGLALAQQILQSGVSPTAVNDDGTAAHNVRVYQLISGLSQPSPLYTQSGPLVVLTYQLGALYQTQCSLAVGTCSTTLGASATLTTSNAATWTTTPPDGAPTLVSTLPLQQSMLSTTVERLDHVRDQLTGYFRDAQIAGAAGDPTNFYPTSAPSLAGASPTSNQGCHDGWYDLTSASVLPTVGLSSQEYGVTAWGVDVEYYRDYDPTNSKAADAPPHYSAVRINVDVSHGLNPDPAVAGNNVILSF